MRIRYFVDQGWRGLVRVCPCAFVRLVTAQRIERCSMKLSRAGLEPIGWRHRPRQICHLRSSRGGFPARIHSANPL
eukprot:7391714-Prymnesium_polylepis.3